MITMISLFIVVFLGMTSRVSFYLAYIRMYGSMEKLNEQYSRILSIILYHKWLCVLKLLLFKYLPCKAGRPKAMFTYRSVQGGKSVYLALQCQCVPLMNIAIIVWNPLPDCIFEGESLWLVKRDLWWGTCFGSHLGRRDCYESHMILSKCIINTVSD